MRYLILIVIAASILCTSYLSAKKKITISKADTSSKPVLQTNSKKNELEFRSVRGRKISYYVFGSGEKTALVFGGIHGDETAGILLARKLIQSFRNLPKSSFSNRIIIIPMANPDGYLAKTRKNAHDIDINRNFPAKDFNSKTNPKSSRYGGKYAASEPETKAIIALVKQYKPYIIISLHTPLGKVVHYGPSIKEAHLISKYTGYSSTAEMGYKMPGSSEYYFGEDKGLKWITVELTNNNWQWYRCGRALYKIVGVSGKEAEALLKKTGAKSPVELQGG